MLRGNPSGSFCKCVGDGHADRSAQVNVIMCDKCFNGHQGLEERRGGK